MKNFGQINNGSDVATKAYVDSFFRGYNTITSLGNIPINKKNVIVSIPPDSKSQVLNLQENLLIGGELFVYIKTETNNFNVMIPVTLGGYPVSYCGYYKSDHQTEYTIPLLYNITKQSGTQDIITRTTVTLHIFFDGSMYYIDRFLANYNANVN